MHDHDNVSYPTEHIGPQIRRARLGMGITQKALQLRYLKLNENRLRNWTNEDINRIEHSKGRSFISAAEARLFAKALDVPLFKLLPTDMNNNFDPGTSGRTYKGISEGARAAGSDFHLRKGWRYPESRMSR